MAHLNIEADDKNLDTVNDFIHSHLEKLGCPMKEIMQIDLAVEEIFVNIAHYAYNPSKGNVEIDCEVEESSPCITIQFSDNGKHFDPLQKEDPDITASAEERDIGGLGIFLTKKYMDCVEYKYENGKNILTIGKKFFKD